MRRRPTDLTSRIEALEEAATLARGRLSDVGVEAAERAAERSNARLRHGTDLTVAAFAGTTGSGKSSLTNAVAGTEVSPEGVTRPTTGVAHAVTFGEVESGALLDWLEVPRRVHAPASDLEGLVLLDLPDVDSVQMDNRIEMARLAGLVDLVVWVTDPQKYADATIHEALAQLVDHDEVTVVTLNQVDLLPADDREQCRADLARIVAGDGLPDARVISSSAVADNGVAELTEVLREAISNRALVVRRLELELHEAAEALRGELGVVGAAGTDRTTESELVSAMANAAGAERVAEAVAAGHVADARAATGWPVTRWLGRFRAHPMRRLGLDRGGAGRSSLPDPTPAQRSRLDGAIRRAADEASAGLAAPWPALVRGAPADARLIADEIDTAAGRSASAAVSRRPRWWTAVGALQWLLAATMVAGLAWLAVLFFLAWFRIPEPPTPEFEGISAPTILSIGGAVLGLAVAWLARLTSRGGGRRRARAVRAELERHVARIAEERVLEPIRNELATATALGEALARVSEAAPAGRRSMTRRRGLG